MAEDGFDATTLARVVAESGIPESSVYHYYGSKDGILLAVMERGAERFFADLPDPDRRTGRAAEHLGSRVDRGREAQAPPQLPAAPDRLRDPATANRQRRDRRRRRSRTRDGAATTTQADRDRLRRRPRQARDHGSRASRSPPSTAPSSPLRPTAQSRSRSCSSRSGPLSSRRAARCLPKRSKGAYVTSPTSQTVKPGWVSGHHMFCVISQRFAS